DSTISVRQLKDMLDERDRGERDFVLIDVREPNEWDIVNIPGAELIPKGQFLNGAALADLPQDRQIVLHCKVGGRSAEVLAIVKSAGFSDAIHVGGGVVAWVDQIEPDKPNY
ncbi:MAG: rhodanese-like domain-containing protein, partial [Candidatus Nanopelagicales bacterium]